MTDKRIPKQGEVWTTKAGSEMRIVNVYPDAVTYYYPDAVTYYYGDGGTVLHAAELSYWLDNSTPPEPTVEASRYIQQYGQGIDTTCHPDTATHRLDLMSDGEFRVVKL